MTKNVPGNVMNSTKLLVLLLSFIAWFGILGFVSDYLSFELWLDLIIVGLIIVMCAGLYLYVPRSFKIHLNGIIIFMVLTLLLISITNFAIQLFLVFFLVANVIYIVFYLGIYTACIDQTREEGISSDEYIKDFNIESKQQDKPQKGFLLKGKQAAGGSTDA
jgi:hypothetical protein